MIIIVINNIIMGNNMTINNIDDSVKFNARGHVKTFNANGCHVCSF